MKASRSTGRSGPPPATTIFISNERLDAEVTEVCKPIARLYALCVAVASALSVSLLMADAATASTTLAAPAATVKVVVNGAPPNGSIASRACPHTHCRVRARLGNNVPLVVTAECMSGTSTDGDRKWDLVIEPHVPLPKSWFPDLYVKGDRFGHDPGVPQTC
jgi:hypothetical protein